jgi:hypothetical protein
MALAVSDRWRVSERTRLRFRREKRGNDAIAFFEFKNAERLPF